jgi:hypothetical protein
MQNIIKNFISKLMIVALVLSITSPLAFMADTLQGTVFISTNNLDSAYSIQKLDGTLVASGAGVAEIQFDIPASDGIGTGYKIVFSPVTGYLTPDTYYFDLSTGSIVHFGPTQDATNNAGSYTPINEGNNAGTVFVYTNLLSSSYSLYKLDDTLVAKGNGVEPTQFDLPAQTGVGTGYKIVFDSVTGYISPSPNPFLFDLVAGDNFVLGPDQVAPYLTGLYTPEDSAGSIQVNVQNELAQPITDGSWTLYTCASASDLSSCATPYLSGTKTTSLPKVPAGIYGLKFSVTTGYSAAAVLSLNPQTLGSGALTFNLQYTTGGVEVNQLGANGILKLYGSTPATISNAIYKEPASLPGKYTLVIASMPAGGGYIIDYVKDGAGNILTAPYHQTLTDVSKIVFNVKYKDIGDKGAVIVKQNRSGGVVDLFGPTSAEITTQNYTNSNSGIGSYFIIPTAPTGYTLDKITDGAGNILTAPYTQALAKDGTVTYNVFWKVTGETGLLTVTQTGAIGTVELDGPSPATVTTATYTDNEAGIGTYTLTSITPPTGFMLDKVTDYLGTTLTAPYTLVLPSGLESGIEFIVIYKVAAAGTITVNQTGTTGGTLNLTGPSPFAVTTAAYTNATAYPGAYTLAGITPPAGFVLDKVTDKNDAALTAPYTQILAKDGAVTYNVIYKTIGDTGTVTVNQTGATGSLQLNGPTPSAIATASYTNAVSGVGIYSLTEVTPPNGYVVDTITNEAGAALTAPYTQTLAKNGNIKYTVTYKAIDGTNAITVNQIGAVGAVSLIGPSPATVTTDTYTNTYAGVGDYTLTGITPPAGFVLDKVTDKNDAALTAPYTQTLGSNEGYEVTYNVYYIPATIGTIQINVVDDIGTHVTNGNWILAGGVTPSTGTDTQTLTRPTGSYTLTATIPTVSAPELAYTSFAITPSATQTLASGANITYTVTYTRPAAAGTVNINVVDNLGAHVSDGSWSITDGTSHVLGTSSRTLILPNGSYTLTAGIQAGNTTYSGFTVAPTGAQALTSGAPLTFTVTYTRISSVNIDLGITSFTLAAASPAPIAGATATYEINYKNLDTVNTATGVKIDVDYDQAHGTVTVPAGCTDNTPSAGIMRCNVANLAPGATGLLPVLFTINAGLPIGTSMVQTATISSASTDSNLTNNTASVTTLVAGALTLTKIVSAASIADNTLVTYTIKLKRNTATPGTINVTIADSFTPSDALNGSNGGTLTYLVNSGACTGVTCSGQNINDAPISVALDSAGSEATITYQARSSNASVPLNGTSVVTNTVTATDNANVLQPLTSQATVTIVGNSGGGGGGGGSTDIGPGGGHKIYRGDLALRIEKMISTDGSKYTAYSGNDMSVAIPEHKTTALYTKVRVTNLGPVSVGNIVLGHLFEQGKSDITSGAISGVSGITIKNNNLTIDKIIVGGSYEFSYKSDLTESASNTNPAKDGLTLVGFKSMLPPTQDGYTYLGIGSKYTTYLFAGTIPSDFKPDKPATITNPATLTNPATGNGGGYSSDSLSINVQSDKASAARGETVNFIITLKNLSNGDLTNLFIDHKYDTNVFDPVQAIGATVDGNGIHWKRPVIRPGQPITLNFSLKAKTTAPIGELIRGLTSALVSEIDGISPVENFVRIVSGPAVNEGEHIQLAATGPAGVMTLILILSILACFGNGIVKNALYISKKKSALAGI